MSVPAAVPSVAVEGFAAGAVESGVNPATLPPGSFVQIPAPVAAPPAPSGRLFTEEEVATIRGQEKGKLYSELEGFKSTLATVQAQLAEKAASELAAQQAVADAEAAKAAAELSALERIQRQQEEFQQQIALQQEQTAAAFAGLQKERDFAALNDYRAQAIEANAAGLIPQLYSQVRGNTPAEIDASIEGLIATSASILGDVRVAQAATSRAAQGTNVTAPPVGPLDTQSGNQTVTAADIAAMSMDEYKAIRENLLGAAALQRGRGLLG